IGDGLTGLPGVEPLDDGRGPHSLADDERPAERDPRIDADDLGPAQAAHCDAGEEAERHSVKAPLDPLEVSLKELSHDDLSGASEVDELTEPFDEEAAGGRPQLVPEKESIDP